MYMKKRIIIAILFTSIFALPFAYTSSIAMQEDKEASDRIEEFYRLAYNGQNIVTEEWFTKEAQSPEIFWNIFDCFRLFKKAWVKDASSRNGFASVTIKFQILKENYVMVDVELHFGNNTSEIIKNNEWRKEDGLWKNDLYPKMKAKRGDGSAFAP